MRVAPSLLNAACPGLTSSAGDQHAVGLLRDREERQALGVELDPGSERWLAAWASTLDEEWPCSEEEYVEV